MTYHRVLRISLFFLCSWLSCFPAEGSDKLQLKIIMGNDFMIGELEDNTITRELLKLSPPALKMEDYPNSEKIAYPPGKLNTSGTKPGLNPKEGDLALFAPWGNLVVFYRNGQQSAGLYYLGRITSDIEKIKSKTGDFESIWEISDRISHNN